MKDIIRRSLPAAVTATLVAGVVAIPAIAATDDSADDTPTTEQADQTGMFGRDGDRGPGFRLGHDLEEGELAERLAAELDLDTDTVQAAMEAVRSDLAGERLAEQVEAGRLTQEQADRVAAALADGDREAAREVVDEVRIEHLTTRLDERVEAGDLTQEQADEILARAEEGDFPHRGRRGGQGPRGLGEDAPARGGAELEDTSV